MKNISLSSPASLLVALLLIFLMSPGEATAQDASLKYGKPYKIVNGWGGWTRHLITCGQPMGCSASSLKHGVHTGNYSNCEPSEFKWIFISATGKQAGETIMDGDVVYLQNQYGPKGYLDVCGEVEGACADYSYRVNTSADKVTQWTIATREVGPVMENEEVQFRNEYGSKGWLGTCGGSDCSKDGNIAGVYPHREEGQTQTTHWKVTPDGAPGDALIYGQKYHLQSGHSNWGGGYLDMCGHAEECDKALYNVSTHSSPNRDTESGNWTLVSASGKPNGSAVKKGDRVKIIGVHGKETNLMLAYGCEASNYNGYQAAVKRNYRGDGEWMIISDGADGSYLRAGEAVSFLFMHGDALWGALICQGTANCSKNQYGVKMALMKGGDLFLLGDGNADMWRLSLAK